MQRAVSKLPSMNLNEPFVAELDLKCCGMVNERSFLWQPVNALPTFHAESTFAFGTGAAIIESLGAN
jgi:hypothetical protein